MPGSPCFLASNLQLFHGTHLSQVLLELFNHVLRYTLPTCVLGSCCFSALYVQLFHWTHLCHVLLELFSNVLRYTVPTCVLGSCCCFSFSALYVQLFHWTHLCHVLLELFHFLFQFQELCVHLLLCHGQQRHTTLYLSRDIFQPAPPTIQSEQVSWRNENNRQCCCYHDFCHKQNQGINWLDPFSPAPLNAIVHLHQNHAQAEKMNCLNSQSAGQTRRKQWNSTTNGPQHTTGATAKPVTK